MIGPASVLRLASDVRFRAVAPETVLVRQSVPEVMVLNEVAGAILERLAAGQPLSEIVEALASLYDAPRADLERDVLAFADELVAASVAEETVA